MLVIKDISLIKTLDIHNNFHESIIKKNTFNERRLKSISLIYASKVHGPLDDKQTSHIENTNIFNSYINQSDQHINKSMIFANKIIKNICDISKNNIEYSHSIEAIEEINVNKLISQLSYETRRSYRLSENFRQLLFRHFEGYENTYFKNDAKKSYTLQTFNRNENHITSVFQNRVESYKAINFEVIDKIIEKKDNHTFIEKIFSITNKVPFGVDFEKRIHLVSQIINSPMIYSINKFKDLNFNSFKTNKLFEMYNKESTNNRVVFEQFQNYDSSSVNNMFNNLTLLKHYDLKNINEALILSNTYRENKIFKYSEYSSSASWILNSLLKARSRSSKYTRQFTNLFKTDDKPKAYNLITYNNIIQESNQVSKNLNMVNKMILLHSRKNENEYRTSNNVLKKKKSIKLENTEDANPFDPNKRKNQNRVVTNLLAMISNEMSKSIVVRNMMNHLFTNTETVTDLRKSEIEYRKMFSTVEKSNGVVSSYNNLEKKINSVELKYKTEKKVIDKNETEIRSSKKSEIINSHEFIKKDELIIEPRMLNEKTINYISERLFETMEAKKRREFARRGR